MLNKTYAFLRSRRLWSTLLLLVIGIGAGSLVGPQLRRVYRYFSLAGYSRLDDYKKRPKVTGEVPNFTLLDANGSGHELYRSFDARAIVIISQDVDCVANERYAYVISGLKKEYETRDVRLFLLNSNPTTTREAAQASQRKFPFRVPLLLDPSQKIAKILGLAHSTEAVLIDPKTWSVVYRGPIDDQAITGQRSEMRNAFLRNALEAFLHDQPVQTQVGQTEICPIAFKQADHTPTYTKDAGPILAKKCLYCHSEAWGIKPYFNNYRTAKSWTAMMKETILTRRMPPWTWDTDVHQPYLYNDRMTMSPDETRTVLDWIDAGAPRGEGGDPLHWATINWQKQKANMPKPDIVVSNKEIQVPPKGFNEYKFYQVDGPTKEDMWVIGTNLSSTNIKTIHHQMLIVTSRPLDYYTEKASPRRDEELVENDDDGGIPAWELHQMRMDNVVNDRFIRIQVYGLGANQPSLFTHLWKDKLGFFVPKGSYLILETHYHGTGKPEKEISSLGLYLHKGTSQLQNINSGKVSFINHIELPPNGRNIAVDADPVILPKRSGLLALGLHMHMRGKSARYYATYPDGKVELLASHPIFNYTTSTARGITFSADKILPAGTQVHIQCTFDNSSENPFNPDPKKGVHWGQTIDRSEMCMGYLWTYEVPEDGRKVSSAKGKLDDPETTYSY